MISESLNIALQLVEALIVFYFYESISKNSYDKLLRLLLIGSSYIIMCIANLLFSYNTVLNVVLLIIFMLFKIYIFISA